MGERNSLVPSIDDFLKEEANAPTPPANTGGEDEYLGRGRRSHKELILWIADSLDVIFKRHKVGCSHDQGVIGPCSCVLTDLLRHSVGALDMPEEIMQHERNRYA